MTKAQLAAHHSRLSKRLHFVFKQVKKQAKKQRGFEVQRTVRKIREVKKVLTDEKSSEAEKETATKTISTLEQDLSNYRKLKTDVVAASGLGRAILQKQLPDGEKILELCPALHKAHQNPMAETAPVKKILKSPKFVKSIAKAADDIKKFASTTGKSLKGLAKKEAKKAKYAKKSLARAADHQASKAPEESAATKRNKHTPAKKTSASNSQFVTSLAGDDISMSDYSGQDSDVETDTKTKSKTKSKPELTLNSKQRKKLKQEQRKSKNRLGQRARQQLWEQKYGKDAKHIKEGKPTVQAREADRVSKRKKTSRSTVQTQSSSSFAGSAKASAAPAATTPAESLHPSWEAKKRAKEAAQKAMSSLKPTKITFD
eukprot:jgi/Hompol1/4913/HPOL_004053-RA